VIAKMYVFKCKMCGGTLQIQKNQTVATCEYCGTKQTLPKLDDEKRANLFDRANHFRRNSEFDKAMSIYEQILNEDDTDAEAHWSIVLCRYGIEYVEDPSSHKRIPTVNRAQFTSIYMDEDYKAAIKNADVYQKDVYESEADTIDNIQKGILTISQKEEPFDVFICYKETDNNGRRTYDSVLGNDLYHELTHEGFKVFYSRITLEDKLGTAYEPYIFAALNSAKVMVVIGTKPEYFNAVWVKNEWSRYLSLIKNGAKKILIPAYKDMDPYDLPEEFSHLQAQDMTKLGFMQDLIRGIKKITADTTKSSAKETVVISSGNANVTALLKRVFMFLEDGEFKRADDFCEQVLNIDAENAQAYLGKLMSELEVGKQEDLLDCKDPFDDNNNYKKALKYSDDKLSAVLKGYISHINDRNEKERLEAIYNRGISSMQSARNETEYKNAAAIFRQIPNYRDASVKIEECLEQAEIARKDAIYNQAKYIMNSYSITSYATAISQFETIKDWKDSQEQIYACQLKIEEIKAKEEADRLENIRIAEEDRLKREHNAEVKRIEEDKRRRRNKKKSVIITAIVAACIVFLVLLKIIIIPAVSYSKAIALYDAGKYNEAITAFESLGSYKDSTTKITECKEAIKEVTYLSAVSLYDVGKYEQAKRIFESLNGYKDSTTKITECKEAIKEVTYLSAVSLYDAGKYNEAITAFESLGSYKDSTTKITECKEAIKEVAYLSAVSLYNAGKYKEAKAAFETIKEYKDSMMYQMRASNKSPEAGSYIYFGQYEQDSNTSNNKKAIEWIVLAKENNKVFVVSRYALDCKKYNETDKFVTWETCTLRTWLNGSFYDNAFSSSEKAMILSSTIANENNSEYGTAGGNKTTDKVFLLSISEAQKYFSSEDERRTEATAYAVKNGARVNDSGYCRWWLRSPGYVSDNAAGVSSVGSVYTYGYLVRDVGNDNRAVRPAMWIDISNLEP